MLKKISQLYHSVLLPPYSPRLNPIEQVFSQWKARARREEIMSHEERKTVIAEDAASITPQDALSYFAQGEKDAYMTCWDEEDISICSKSIHHTLLK
jgi:transposase